MARLLKRAWEFTSLALGAFAMYRQIQMLQEYRKETYAKLTPQEREVMKKYYSKIQTPLIQPVEASDLEKLKAQI